MNDDFPEALDPGWVEADLAAEFPELRMQSVAVACRPGPTAGGVRQRLRMASNRIDGARAIAMRREPIPSAYRVFFRLIGLDPDHTRTPVEQAALERLMTGDFAARDRVSDALLLAVVETSVPVYALDDATLDGPLGIRAARAGERLGDGEYANDLPAGRLVVADSSAPVAELFGLSAPDRAVRSSSRRLRLFSLGVKGVPEIHVEESLWTAIEALSTP